MRIGTVRPEEARVFDRDEGYHRFHNEDGLEYGSFEVFWWSGEKDEDEEGSPAGWYWHSCFPGCLPDSEASGPFSTSTRAMYDADEFHPDNMEE